MNETVLLRIIRLGRRAFWGTVFITLLATPPLAANGLRVETVRTTKSAAGNVFTIEARVRWFNSWRNARNHDAVWLVTKLRGNPHAAYAHGRLSKITSTGMTPGMSCTVSADHVGAFCAPTAPHRGPVEMTVTLEVEASRVRAADIAAGTIEALVFGVEMVYVPAGPFSIGNADSALVGQNAFYKSDAQGKHAGTFRITSEAELPISAQPNAIYYKASQYGGDALGPLPAAFPKGTRAFYVMKYEVLQGQYAAFLNTLAEYATSFRSPTGGRDYYTSRGTIRLENGVYVAGSPDRPANMMSWDDGAAFADWAGLRPWTELEFTKAARGPVEPVANDFPWGTAGKDRLLRRNAPNDELVQTGDADESKLSDATRDVFGASYYWVMDLGGSVWEKVVTIGHPKGRAFVGTHGDGQITDMGMATNADWPAGDHDGGGYGYRGGGYYERGMTEGALNPHSRTEQRPYGSWGGAPRGVGYGFRAARTADTN